MADFRQDAGADQQGVRRVVQPAELPDHQAVELLVDNDARLDADIQRIAGIGKTGTQVLGCQRVVGQRQARLIRNHIEAGGERVQLFLVHGIGLVHHPGDGYFALQIVMLHQRQVLRRDIDLRAGCVPAFQFAGYRGVEYRLQFLVETLGNAGAHDPHFPHGFEVQVLLGIAGGAAGKIEEQVVAGREQPLEFMIQRRYGVFLDLVQQAGQRCGAPAAFAVLAVVAAARQGSHVVVV